MKPIYRLLRFLLGLGLLLASASGAALAQDGPARLQAPDAPPDDPLLASLPLNAGLYYAARSYAEQAGSMPGVALSEKYARTGLLVDEQARVLVEISGQRGGPPLDPALIKSIGGEVTGTWRHLTEALLPVGAVIDFAVRLPPGYFIQSVGPGNPDDVDGEGPAATNAGAYRDNGADCTGMVIAVIDNGYLRLTEAQANGDLPPDGARLVRKSYTDSHYFEDVTVHGTAVAETVYDYCPGATYRLYQVDVDHTDFANAIDDAIVNNVDVFAHSMSWYNTGWDDDSGELCDALIGLGDALFFTSAGNRAQSHWQGDFSDPDSDGWHNWTSASELLELSIDSNGNGGHINTYLSWDLYGGNADYDLYLYDSSVNLITRTNTAGNAYEKLFWVNPGAATTWYLAVKRASGAAAELELFDHNGGTWDPLYITEDNSTNSPANCTGSSNVLAVGAVRWNNYGQASPSIESYSSRGPTNEGGSALDLAGPTNTNSFAYSGPFSGTSAATPNAAGAGAAFWSDQEQLSRPSIRWLLKYMAYAYKDWGAAHQDETFGWGGIFLHPWAAGTIWLDRNYNNTAGDADKPYYYLSHAVNAAPVGGRLVFIGDFPEAITVNKALLFEVLASPGWDSTLGGP